MPRKKKTPDTELGRKLMQIRLENNLSVLGMAERIGRNKATISRYEDGRTIPDAETITAYCREFDLDPNYLLGWVNSKKDELTEEQFLNLWMKHGKKLWAELNR